SLFNFTYQFVKSSTKSITTLTARSKLYIVIFDLISFTNDPKRDKIHKSVIFCVLLNAEISNVLPVLIKFIFCSMNNLVALIHGIIRCFNCVIYSSLKHRDSALTDGDDN